MSRNSGDPFDGVSLFVGVVEAGSFTAAGARSGHSVSHVSKTVSRLQDRLGGRLLNRTTRTLGLDRRRARLLGPARPAGASVGVGRP